MSAEIPASQPVSEEKGRIFLPTDVLPEWYDRYKYSNLHHPRDTHGIFPLVGNEIVQSLSTGRVTLGDITTSMLTPSQFSDLEETLVHAHTAFQIPAMPEGHAHKGQSEFSAEHWLHGNWTDIKTSVIRTLALFASTTHPSTMKIQDLSLSDANRVAYELSKNSWWDINDGIMDRAIQGFMNEKEYSEVLPTVAKMYTTVAEVLIDPESLQLARRRKEKMSAWYRSSRDMKYDNNTESDYKWEIVRRMRLKLTGFDVAANGNELASILFLSGVTNESRSDIREQTWFSRVKN